MPASSRKKRSARSTKLDASTWIAPTPRLRVESLLAQIEARAKALVALLEQGLPTRAATAKRTLEVYRGLRGKKRKTEDERAQLTHAARMYVVAANAVRPPQWADAREALVNVELVRKGLVAENADEAVEAALRAMNAMWRFEAKKLEKQFRIGEKTLSDRSKGGKNRAANQAEKLAERDANIRRRAQNMVELRDTSRTEIQDALAECFGLSKKQIKRILSKPDMC